MILVALLRPVLLACVSGNFEGFTSLDDAMKSQSDISVFSKPYLLQIALLIAISHENDTLASELAKVGRPPPRCVFHLEHGPPRIINQGVLSILIGRGWIIAHQATVFYAVKSSDATSSIALFQAIADSDFDLDNDIYRTALPKLAAKYGSPEMLQHILAYFSIPRPDPNLILEAVRERKSGGADMLRYLMNQATDVNHTKASNIPRSNGSSKPGHGGYGDPRARAEMEYAQITARYGQSTSRHSPGADTALHLAAQNGNLDAVRVLLDRGARRDAKDAAGRTPSQRVQQVNRKEVLKMLEEQM